MNQQSEQTQGFRCSSNKTALQRCHLQVWFSRLNNLVPSNWLWCVIFTLKIKYNVYNFSKELMVAESLDRTSWLIYLYTIETSLLDEAVLLWEPVWFPISQFEQLVQRVLNIIKRIYILQCKQSLIHSVYIWQVKIRP